MGTEALRVGGVMNKILEWLNDIFNWGSIAVGSIISIIIVCLGGRDKWLELLVIGMIIDFATGIMKGIKTKLDLDKCYDGIIKKVTMFLILWLATTLDKALGVTEQSINFRFATITFFLGYEGISIHENATFLGVPFPTKLKEKLQQYKDEVFDKEK